MPRNLIRGENRQFVSLWDMLKDDAADFVELGEAMASAQALWGLFPVDHLSDDERLNAEGKELLRVDLSQMLEIAKRLDLPVSMKLIGRRLGYKDSIPETPAEFAVITEVLKDELASKLFLFVPSDRAPYWENDKLLSDEAKAAFPVANSEIREAAKSYAAGLNSASVFHSMRAVEHGLRALSAELQLQFTTQQWQNIIDEIQKCLEGMRKSGIPGLDKQAKDEKLQFYSETAKEFAYFKDGWRNYVAHNKVPYDPYQALMVLNHVADFIGRLSSHLKE